MTCTLRARILRSFVSRLITILVVSIALAGPTKLTSGEGPPSRETASVPSAQDVNPPTFQPVVQYGSGGIFSYAVAVADVNNDGKPDLLVVSCSLGGGCGGIDGAVGVLLGNGDGTFQPAVTYDAGGDGTNSIVAADVNGDGKLDIVVTNSYYSNTIGVLLGNGDGTFQPVVTYSSGGGYPSSVAVADVNGDGKPDILVANGSSCYACNDMGLVGVLLGNGDGTFQPAVTYSSGGYNSYNGTSLAVSDLNGDGKLDVAVTNACGETQDCSRNGSVGVLLGNGDGTFQPAITYDAGAKLPRTVVLADMNGDGKLDLLLANNCSVTVSCVPGTVGVLLGNGNGTFRSARLYHSGGHGANSLAIGDVNGDGKLDVVVSDFCSASSNGHCNVGTPGVVAVLLGEGDGVLQPPALVYPAGGSWGADWIAVADVNGDGRPDLLVANIFGSSADEGSVGVLLNTSLLGIASPTTVNFGDVVVGDTSTQHRISLKNPGTSKITISKISLSKDFALAVNYCDKGVKPGTHCDVYVTFSPGGRGTHTGTLTFVDNAANSPQTVSLTGVGLK
jgi:FG-GAP-like repeat/Abnormal spindle-like microcephaly-assoc'd, ASPM-SPD-2-Hydin/FG-GAP repeat